ncbi:MAG: SDR family NAD(P)-dependent oxidoreductase, partial [Eubacteriales bacterium]
MSAKLRTLYIIILDYFTLLICFFASQLLLPGSIEGTVPSELPRVMLTMATLLVVYPLVFSLFGVYKIIHRYAQSREYLQFFCAFLAAGVVFTAVSLLEGMLFSTLSYPIFFLIFFSLLASIALMLTRLIYRLFVNRADAKNAGKMAKNTLIVGCGQACLLLLNEVKVHPEYGIHPVVAVDIDPAKNGRTIAGVPIEGTDEKIPELCAKYDIALVIVAIPSANNKQRAAILENCKDTNVVVKMLPRITDFHDNDRGVYGKLRDFTMDELLGRDPIEINHEEVNAFIRGKKVLVTGGGGSIGSELCRQIASNSPEKLIIVDIYENNAYDIQQELAYKYGDRLDFVTIIASVRDAERMDSIMAQYKPDIVIHAAAHKHVPLMEVSPQEAVKNNVFGTLNTAKAAIHHGVSKFI